jgi:DNA polymerase-3 subunit alpha
MPDIDVDFCMNRRGEVIQYVTEKYGRDQVAQIITFNTLATRAAIKDVGRVLELSFADVDKITKLIPNTLGIKLKDAIAQEPGLGELAAKDSRIKEVLDIAQRLEGFARNSSVHASAVVIAPVALKTLVPLSRTNREEVVTQYDMDGIEKMGVLKMDFLGLTTLTLIDDALKMIERRHGVKIVIDDLPVEDPGAYDIFCKGFTSGVFQFESPGMRDILRRYQPSRIEDLTALNALYRPGPIQGGMLDDFIERKHGRKAVIYDLPELKELLGETFGIILYQEQVMQISNRLAGYSLGDADMLRRAMGKKKPEEMAKQRERFVNGALEKGHPQKKIEKIFDLMEQFAGYGFNKSHSAAYAFLAFVTAYLKAHYPVDFMAALLTSETGNVAKVVKYINECREMSIRVLPPDINYSDLTFTPVRDEKGDAIRFGLGAVKNVGTGAVEAIVKARREHGRFKSLHQFCEKADMSAINRRVIESLIKAGALDSLEGTRAQQLLALDGAIESGTRAARDRDSGQVGLFGAFLEEDHPEPSLPKANDWTAREKLVYEKEMLGFYVTGHPLDSYEEKICELATHDSSRLEDLEKGTDVALCGILTGIQRRRNREGKPWASMVIEDRLGTIDGMVFTTSYEALAPTLEEDKAVLIRGSALPEEGNPTKVSVKEIVPLDVARVSLPSLISIKVYVGRNGIDRASELQTLFARKPGNTQVRLRLESTRDFSVILDVPVKVRPDKEFKGEIARICGPDMLEVLGS